MQWQHMLSPICQKRILLIDSMLKARNIEINQMNTAPDSWSLDHGDHKSYTKITNGIDHSKPPDKSIWLEKKFIVNICKVVLLWAKKSEWNNESNAGNHETSIFRSTFKSLLPYSYLLAFFSQYSVRDKGIKLLIFEY